MQLTLLTCLLLFLTTSHWALADEEKSTDSNEIIPREAIQKLDFSVRLALLRAIDKLELEAREGDDDEDELSSVEHKAESITTVPSGIIVQSTTALPFNAQINDEILEESTSSSDIFPSVQFFTATYDEKSNQEQPLAIFIDKSKNSINKNLGSPAEVSNHIRDETKVSYQAARSVSNTNVQQNEISSNDFDEIKFEIRNTKSSEKTSTTSQASISRTTTTTTPRPRTTKKPTITTTTTTTTTTPRPTHNEDGENIEVVAKDDIRIQAAPLVSAFTVDLDELGAAKKVRPIIDNPASTAVALSTSTPSISSIFQPPLFGPTITELNVLPADGQRSAALNLVHNLPPPLPTQSTLSSSTVSNIISNIVPTSGHFITKQPLAAQQQQQNNNVNNYLYEKQRELEQQIYQLKLQAQQQQELIIRQLKLLEEQAKQKSNSLSTTSPFQQAHVQQQQQQQPLHLSLVQQNQQESGFTIRPSIEFIPSTQSKIAPVFSTFSLEQQLPLKESNGKYINGLQQKQQQQYQQNNRFSINNNQPQNQQQQQQQQQRLPIENNPIQQVFQKLQNLQKSNTHTASSISSIQIQPSNQLNISPTFASLLPQVPAELSLVQALPQRNYQQFQQNPLVPQYVTNAILERQQQQQQQQQQQNRARLFRQEGDTANFGLNQLQAQTSSNIFPSFNQQQQQPTNNFDNQNFYRQHLIPEFSNQLQQNAQQFYQQQPQQNSQTGNYYNNQRFHRSRYNSLNNNLEEFNIINKVLALNHGINNFAPQSLLPPTQSSVGGTQPLLAQSARFNSNIF